MSGGSHTIGPLSTRLYSREALAEFVTAPKRNRRKRIELCSWYDGCLDDNVLELLASIGADVVLNVFTGVGARDVALEILALQELKNSRKEEANAKTSPKPFTPDDHLASPLENKVIHEMCKIDSPRDVVKFFQNLIPCTCLDAAMMEMSADARIGACLNRGCDKTEGVVKLMDCGRCMTAKYCSKECQVAAWPEHKSICRMIAGPKNQKC